MVGAFRQRAQCAFKHHRPHKQQRGKGNDKLAEIKLRGAGLHAHADFQPRTEGETGERNHHGAADVVDIQQNQAADHTRQHSARNNQVKRAHLRAAHAYRAHQPRRADGLLRGQEPRHHAHHGEDEDLRHGHPVPVQHRLVPRRFDVQRQPRQPHTAREQPAEPLRRPPHRAPLHEKGAQQRDAGGEQGKAERVGQRERFAHGDAGRQRQGEQAGGAGEREGSLKGEHAVEVAVAIQQRHEALRQRRADLHQTQPEHQPDQLFRAGKALHHVVNRQHQQAAGGDGGGNTRDEFHFVMVINQLQQAGGKLGEQGDADEALQAIRLADFEKEDAHAGVSHEIRRLNPAALLQIER